MSNRDPCTLSPSPFSPGYTLSCWPCSDPHHPPLLSSLQSVAPLQSFFLYPDLAWVSAAWEANSGRDSFPLISDETAGWDGSILQLTTLLISLTVAAAASAHTR